MAGKRFRTDPEEIDEETLEYAFHLKHRGFYVEPLTKPLDVNSIPCDGNEYIHIQRLENIDLESFSLKNRKPDEKSSVNSRHHEWKQKAAERVSNFSKTLNENREELQKRFPKSLRVPLESEIASCAFCLGFELCSKIYGEIPDAGKEECHQPVLNIVLYLSQKDVELLLQYLYRWYQDIGMEIGLSEWLYALSVCLKKPLSKNANALFEKFYEDCVKRCKTCENESEKMRFHLFLGIFRIHFSAALIGAPLLKYHELRLF